MSDGLNKCMLLGNLGADPELRYTQGGQAVLHLRLATTESYLDKDKVRRERTDWHSVTVFGKRGEALGKILAKGSTIFVEGRLQTSSYDDREGNKRYRTEVVATNVILAGGKRDAPTAREDGWHEGNKRSTANAPPPEAAPDDWGDPNAGGGDDIPF